MIHMTQRSKWRRSTKIDSGLLILSMIHVYFQWIWTWDQFYSKGYLLSFPRNPGTSQLDVVYDLGISFNMDNSWTSWTLDIEIVSPILIESDFSWTSDWFHWKVCLVLFPCICRTSKSDVVHILYINLKPWWSWTMSWTQSQTQEFQIRLDFHLDVHTSLPLQCHLDVLFVLLIISMVPNNN
jgi:hypothetical protein